MGGDHHEHPVAEHDQATEDSKAGDGRDGGGGGGEESPRRGERRDEGGDSGIAEHLW